MLLKLDVLVINHFITALLIKSILQLSTYVVMAVIQIVPVQVIVCLIGSFTCKDIPRTHFFMAQLRHIVALHELLLVLDAAARQKPEAPAMSLHSGLEHLEPHPQDKEHDEEAANADDQEERPVHGRLEIDKVIVLAGLVEEAEVNDSDLDDEGGRLEFVESFVVEGRFGDLHRQEADQKQDGAQGLHSSADRCEESHQEHQEGFTQQENYLPVVVFFLVAVCEEPEAQSVPVTHSVVDGGI